MPAFPRAIALIALELCCASLGRAQGAEHYPTPVEGDFVVEHFVFANGDSLSELRLHYTTLGTPRRDSSGVVRNAVLILHGTTGSGHGFLSENFAGHLFSPGQLLDASKYFIILPDDIGHGGSSRPSDGLRMHFPKYAYTDMVRAEHALVADGLHVNHLRLVMGTSMGAMHTWMWGYMYPDFMDALMPLASAPVQIAGRNRMMRRMIIDVIEHDPSWQGGDYAEQPRGLTDATYILMLMVSSPRWWQRIAPTAAAADSVLDATAERYASHLDANDVIYAFDASRDYDPSPHLAEIRAPLLAINSADDQVNPPELGILEREIRKVPHGRFVLLPITDETRGHGTHSLPAVWGRYLAELLRETEQPLTSSP